MPENGGWSIDRYGMFIGERKLSLGCSKVTKQLVSGERISIQIPKCHHPPPPLALASLQSFHFLSPLPISGEIQSTTTTVDIPSHHHHHLFYIRRCHTRREREEETPPRLA